MHTDWNGFGIILGIIADEAIYNLPNVFSGVYLGATVATILGAIQYIFLDSLRGLLIGVPISAMIGGVLCIIAKRTSKPSEPATAEWGHSVEGLTRGGALIAAIAAVFATVVGACIGAPLVGSFIYAYWGALLSDMYLLPATTFSAMLGALTGALVATLICRTAVMRAWMLWHKADLGGILPGQYYENSRSAYNGATIGALIGIFIGATIGSAFGGFVFAVFGGSLGWMEGEWLGAAIGEARRSTSESLVVYPKGGRHFVAGAFVGLLVGAYFLAVFSGAAEPRTALDVQVFSVTYSAPIGVCAVLSSWLIVGRLMGERIGSIIDLRLI